MTSVSSFVNRLAKIGINVELVGNYPWVYMRKVNGNSVKDKWLGNHGFTVFFRATKPGQSDTITDINVIFKQIRKLL